MPNLGEQLKQIKIKIQNRETERQRREAEAARLKLIKEKNEVDYCFRNAWSEMVDSIAAESLPQGFEVKKQDTPLKFHKRGLGVITPESQLHPHHDVYR